MNRTKPTKLIASLRIIIPLWMTFILIALSLFFIFVPSLEKNIIDQKRAMIRNLTDSNWSLLSEYNQMVEHGELTFDAARSEAIRRIRGLRYGPEGKDYFWINDMHPRMIMHPYFTNLEGHDLTNYVDPNGKHLFLEFIKTVDAQGSGFVDYEWQWKDDPTKVVPKISYVRGFEPWGWIIGTGIYIEDVRYEIKLIMQDLIKLFISLLIIIIGLSSYITFQAIKVEKKRNQTEQALQASHERFLTVLNSIDATIYVADMETYEIIFMNKYMIESFGGDKTGAICWKIFRREGKPCSHCNNDQLLDKNNKPTGVHIWQDKNPVTGKWYTNYDRAIEWENGRCVKLQIATDITYLKEMEEELRQAHKMESIGTLAGGIAHDFNNILFPIVGHTELLLENMPETSPFRSSVNKIYNSALRARDLVKQILTFSRQDISELKPIKIQPIIKEALKLIRSSISTTIDINQNIEIDCGMIKADPTQIHQIIMNLTTNAYHAMEETGGELKVSLKEIKLNKDSVITPDMTPGIYAWLTVADTGTGMDKTLTSKIFDPFFTTKKLGKGTGMGLSVVHGIVKNIGGTIQVKSEPDKGTEFNIYLPIIQKSPEEQNIQIKKQLQKGNEHILLVDDEEDIVIMEKQMLEHFGYQVTSYTSSVEALEAFQEDPDKFDMVITDMAMPNIRGDKLSAELTKIRPDIPILLCTGFSEVMSEEQAASLGIKGFLMKPIMMKALASKIREVLDED